MRTLILSSFFFAQSVFAAVTIQFEFEALRDSSGVAVVNNTVFALIAADINNELPSAADLLNEDIILGDSISGSKIFYVGQTDSDAGAPGRAGATVSDLDFGVELGDASAGSIWGIYWFPNITTPGSTIVAGSSVGIFQISVLDGDSSSGSVEFNADTPMTFLASGTARTLYYDVDTLSTFGTPTANTPSVSDFSANFTVIPEPSAFLLGLLGAGSIFLRRRR